MIGFLILACSGGSGTAPTPTSSPSAGPTTPGESPEPTATAASTATTAPTPTATPDGPRDPHLPDPPPSPFEPWTGEDLVVYDVVAGVEVNLGPGRVEPFSPERPTLGLRGFTLARDGASGSVIGLDEVFPGAPSDFAPPTVQRVGFLDSYPYWLNSFLVQTPEGPRSFEAYAVALLDESRLVMALLDEELPAEGPERVTHRQVSLQLYDLQTDSVTPLGTALASPLNWSFDAAAGRVLWAENQCVFDDDTEQVFVLLEVDTGDRIEFTSDHFRWVKLTPDGRLALSRAGFGASAIFNLRTRQYDAVLPEEIVDVIWSADYRYAAAGTRLGHGGLCALN